MSYIEQHSKKVTRSNQLSRVSFGCLITNLNPKIVIYPQFHIVGTNWPNEISC